MSHRRADLVHVLLSEAILCLLRIIALMIAHWRALRRTHHDQRQAAPWVQHGTVALHPGQPAQVARMEYLGWVVATVVALPGAVALTLM